MLAQIQGLHLPSDFIFQQRSRILFYFIFCEKVSQTISKWLLKDFYTHLTSKNIYYFFWNDYNVVLFLLILTLNDVYLELRPNPGLSPNSRSFEQFLIVYFDVFKFYFIFVDLSQTMSNTVKFFHWFETKCWF